MRACARSVVALLLATALAGCDEGTAPVPDGEGLHFTFDGGAHNGAGMPAFTDGEFAGETFAIAFPDSVGGLVLASFERKSGTVGDLFILQLTRREAGDFDPCGTGHECHGRLLDGLDATDLQSLEAAWEVTAGTTIVEELTEQRVVGGFRSLLLVRQDGGTTRSIDGTFDLPLLSEAEGVDIMKCFLTRVTGGAC